MIFIEHIFVGMKDFVHTPMRNINDKGKLICDFEELIVLKQRNQSNGAELYISHIEFYGQWKSLST